MKMTKLRTTLVLLGAAALSLSACARYEHKDDHHGKVDIAAIKAAITADEKAWSDQFQARPRSLDALVARYTADADFVTSGVKANGSANIRKAYEEGLKDPNFNFTFAADQVDVAASGDLAYARGRFKETYTDAATDKPKSDTGSFITVYKKQEDGSWKVVQDWAVADPEQADGGGM
jgi:ketosteroid isomerase-like protein